MRLLEQAIGPDLRGLVARIPDRRFARAALSDNLNLISLKESLMRHPKWRSTYVGVLAALVGGMAFVPVASAHTLGKESAESSARWVAKQKVNDTRTPYTYSEAVCDPDSQAVPHIRGCTLKYDTPTTRSTNQWACVERIQIYYKAHSRAPNPVIDVIRPDGAPREDYTKYWRAKDANGNYFTHPC